MRAADPGVMDPWYEDIAATRYIAMRNAKLLRASMVKGTYHEYLPEPEKSWHIFAEGKEE